MNTQRRQSTGVDNPSQYWIHADHHLRALAEEIGDTYMDLIIDSIINQPRSLQKRIGPSEMAQPCSRAILHRLNGDPEPPQKSTPWKPTIGTAMHAYLEEVFSKASLPGQLQAGRWLVENKVDVAKILGEDIDGSTDLFDTWNRVVLDHKLVGKYTMKKYRSSGPSPQYRGQAHLYGYGWKQRGYDPRMVAICFLPREGELDDTYIWTEPYQEDIALEAIARCQDLASLLQIVGIDQALRAYPLCTEFFCSWCKAERAGQPAREPTAYAATDLL